MMKKLFAALVVMGTTAALTQTVAVPVQAAPDDPQKLVCDNTRDDPYSGTYASVRVPKGASCYLDGATVLGNLKALHGAVDVIVFDTSVKRNLTVRGATRDVKIGPEDCRFDPPVGNNVRVTRSHNVAICLTTVKDNLTLTRNDGRIMVRDNVVGSSIRIVKNRSYNWQAGDGDHPNMDMIRVYRNVADRHIVVKDNADRPVRLEDNTPDPIV